MITLLLFSAAMGWCGTPWPGWWRFRRKPPPPPPPDWLEYLEPGPIPWRIVTGIIGGVASGLTINAAAGIEQMAAIGLAAFAGGRILTDIVTGIRASMK